MTACAYRSLEPVLQQRLVALRDRRETDAVFVDLARRVASRRIGRAWGGAAATGVALATFAVGLSAFFASGESEQHLHAWATGLLLAAWPLGVAVAIVVRLFARRMLDRRLDAPLALTGHAELDLARVEAGDPLQASVDFAWRIERWSVALPMAAVALLAPLTIHWIVWCILSAASSHAPTLADFGEWIGLSALIVGHAHLAVLVGAVRWALKLRSVDTIELRRGLLGAWGLTLLVAIGVACLPGVVLFAIPPVLVAATGLAFIPAMFVVAAQCVRRERLALDAM